MTDHEDTLAELYDHLAATAERPVERAASRWLGEAEAVAADLAEGDPDEAVIEDRLGTVAHLLEQIEEIEDEQASEHVAAAREIVTRLQE
ncbi:MAG: hypothetical protein ABEH35_03805 [Haloarculaceae archaeon]